MGDTSDERDREKYFLFVRIDFLRSIWPFAVRRIRIYYVQTDHMHVERVEIIFN